jgi:DNA-binding response OmpR family regulator
VAGDLSLDLLRRKVTRNGERLTLTNKEFALLHLLLSREGGVIAFADCLTDLADELRQ